MKEQKQEARRAWSSAQKLRILLLLSGSLAITLYSCAKYQAARRLAGYEQVVRLVQAGQLIPDIHGDIRLPSRWKWLTRNGHIYQCKDPTAGEVLLFPAKVKATQIDWGKGKVVENRQIEGYLYCPGPLPKDGWFLFAGMEAVRTGEQQRLASHWFYAEPFYS